MSTFYGNKLDPYHSERTAYSVKGNRQSIVVTNNPSTIGPGQLLSVEFPNLGSDDLIIPGTARLAFNISLKSTDANCTVVNNLGRAIVKKISVKMGSKEITCLDNADIYLCYCDLWMTKNKRLNAAYYGIHSDDGNTAKIRLGAGDAVATTQPGAAIAATFRNRFAIPLDFEILTDHGPFCQAGLTDRLSFELVFNDCGRVIISTDTDATYQITNIALEFDIITQEDLARLKRQQYTGMTTVLYTNVLYYRRETCNKSDPRWNIDVNIAANSLKGVLMLVEDPAAGAMGPAFGRNSEFYYNPLITKVQISVDGISNQLYAQGMTPHQHWEEIVKEFVREDLRSSELATDMSTYLQSRYALWLDFRSSDDHKLHGSGRKVGRIAISLDKTVQTAGPLICHVYLLIDAQMNIENGRLVKVFYHC